MIGVDWFIKKIESKYDIGTFLNRHLINNFVVDKRIFPVVQSRTGELYHIHSNICTVKEVYNQYKFDDIRLDDIVIDIGSNVGAFSLMASNISYRVHAYRVHAYEPILYNELVMNVKLNLGQSCVIPHKEGLGYGYGLDIVWWEGEDHLVPLIELAQMKEDCGGCDFLKCDCEGAEWGIKIDELKDIRRIEIEFHFNTHYKLRPELIDEIQEYFDCTINKTQDTWWVHGVNKNAG